MKTLTKPKALPVPRPNQIPFWASSGCITLRINSSGGVMLRVRLQARVRARVGALHQPLRVGIPGRGQSVDEPAAFCLPLASRLALNASQLSFEASDVLQGIIERYVHAWKNSDTNMNIK